jgi:NAD(P)H-nitrite reductase large subunit
LKQPSRPRILTRQGKLNNGLDINVLLTTRRYKKSLAIQRRLNRYLESIELIEEVEQSYLQIANGIHNATNEALDKVQKEKRKEWMHDIESHREQEKSIQQILDN